MNYIKKFMKLIVLMLCFVIISAAIILAVDHNNTSYLNTKNTPELLRNSYLITKVHVLPMYNDTILYNKTVLVRDGIIEKVADTIEADDVETIDGGHSYLSPGLIDMHVHVWDKYELGLYLANGVTAIRNLWGIPLHLRIKRDINEGDLLGPTFFTASPKLTAIDDLGDDKVQVASPEEARELVQEYKERGFDFIKTYAGIPENILDAIIDQANLSDISIVSHPSFKVPYEKHFNPQIATIEHAEDIVQQALNYELDSTKLALVVTQYAQSGTSFSPTLTGYYKIFEMLEDSTVMTAELTKYINPLMRKFDSEVQFERWSNEKRNNPSISNTILEQHNFHLFALNKLQNAGVNIVCSTDAGIGITAAGFSIHQELALYKQAGLSNYEALKTATVNPSITHKEMKQLGTIEHGKWANLVLSSKNPLLELGTLRNPKWVMVQGRKIDEAALNEFKEKAKNRKNLAATALRYIEYLYVEK